MNPRAPDGASGPGSDSHIGCFANSTSRISRSFARSMGRLSPLKAVRATTDLLSGVFGPVDISHGSIVVSLRPDAPTSPVSKGCPLSPGSWSTSSGDFHTTDSSWTRQLHRGTNRAGCGTLFPAARCLLPWCAPAVRVVGNTSRVGRVGRHSPTPAL